MSQDDLCETSRDQNRISMYNVWGLTGRIPILVDHYTGLIFIRMIHSRFVKTACCALVATIGVSVLGFAQDFSLTVEATPAVTEGMTQYRFYVNMNDASDRMSAVFGNNEYTLSVEAPEGAFNSTFNSSWNASGINPAFVPVFPELVDDTYATIGLEGPASSSGLEGAADPSIVEDSNQPITPFFLNDGATSLLSNTLTGASWYILNTASNGLPDSDLRVLLMQVTSSGNVSGQMNFQVFPLGIGADQQQLSVAFDGAGTFGGGDEAVLGCTDAVACNFNEEATEDDGSCEFTSCVVSGCTDELACNFDAAATEEDGSCDFCSCQRAATPYTLVVEGTPAVVAGMTTYRFYVTLPDEGDRFSAVFGNNESNLEVSAPDGVYNSTFNSSWNASGVNPAFLPAFPELAADTYATVGLEGPASTSGQAGAADPSIVEDANQMITPFFLTDGATLMESNTLTGASWYVLNTASNGLANDDNRVLIMQVTTAGNVSGQISYQVFPLGVGADQQQLNVAFDGEGIFGGDEPTVACGCTDDAASNYDPEATYDDGSCLFDVAGCTDAEACNYEEDATVDDGSCEFAEPLLDCEGNCLNDADGDGICDEVEEGCTDADACNYDPSAAVEDGTCTYPEEDYLDCEGNCLNDDDEDGVCDEIEVLGCTAPDACNYNADATEDDGTCEYTSCVVSGCTDDMACNYNAEATEDDGSCEYTSCVVSGCTDALACNYNAEATEDDGSCDFCSCQRPPTPYTLVVEGAPAVVSGMTTYRFYVTLPDAGDRFSAVFGNDESTLEVSAPEGVFNSPLNSSWNASGINPAFLPAFPELASDTYATIGLEGPASTSGQAGAADPSIVEDANQMITPFFLNDGATSLLSNTLTGASWYILNTASNGLADANGRVLIMQVTTAGNVSGQISYQVFPLGEGANQQQLNVAFDGVGEFGGEEPTVSCGCTDDAAVNFDPNADYDDGSCVFDVLGCTDAFACNYDEAATQDDGSCVYCDCGGEDAPAYTLSVEASAAVQSGATTYRFYVNMVNATDKLSAVYGNNEEALSIQAPAGIYNSELNTSWNASGLAAAFVDLYPEMADDSYATIGLTGPASEAASGSVNPDLAESVEAPLTIADFFTTGGADLDISDAVGGIWYVAGPATNANAGEEGRVLVMQITTEGALLGTVNAQIFPEGDGQEEFKLSWTFSGAGTIDADGFGNACGCTDAEAINYNPAAEYDDGSCVFGVAGCTDATASNYEEDATLDDGSCEFPEPGLNCDGTCVNDADGDGVCDENEVLGCTNPDATNYDPAATDDDGSCDVLGCTYALANNYNEAATDDDGSCEFDLTGSSCPGDLDGSGLVQLNDLLDFLLVYGTYCDE